MSKFYLANAFSLNMLSTELDNANIEIKKLSRMQVLYYLDNVGSKIECVIGHKDLMTLVNNQLKTGFEANRATIELNKGDEIIVAQYRGQRLPEGTTELPEGAVIEYYFIKIN